MQRRRSSENLADYQAKYHDQSLIAQLANRRFFQAVTELTSRADYDNLLDAGCGEGAIIGLLNEQLAGKAIGLDLDARRVRRAAREIPADGYCVGNTERLPFAADSFDLVLSLEVLEHVGDPQAALAEIRRVTRSFLLASVPNEPWWRFGNMLRLKYLEDFGNTPEHINHWTVAGFKRFIGREFKVLEVQRPFLWTFILAKK
jgi:ubiquinone/menaquinone biosynthesis C-methylase UbiE